VLEGLPLELARLAPALGRPSVGWRTKDLGDGRTIWVGRCPFRHDSGTSGDGDLSAGTDRDGRPYVRCLHGSCTEVPALDRRLKAAARPAGPPPAGLRPLEPTPIAAALLRDLEDRRVAYHEAPTGAGKSHAEALAAACRYRDGLATALAVPTRRLAGEMLERLRDLVPDAFEAGAVAAICGRNLPPPDADADDEAGADEEPDDAGAYPIHPRTRIVVTSHAQLGRRGFSKFLRAIWTGLAAGDDEEGPRPAFALIIDEAPELVRACRWEIPLAHRVRHKDHPDGSGGRLVPLKDCPKSNRSGNCADCVRRLQCGELRFNPFAIRELGPPRGIDLDGDGHELRRPQKPLVVTAEDLALGGARRVGHTTFAAEVLAWRGRPIDANTRRTAPLYLFRGEGEGRQPPETPHEILGHLLEHAFRPVVTWERPVDEGGRDVDPELLKFRIEHPSRHAAWDEGITFPLATCNVPRLRFADLAGLEQMRRFAREQEVGIVFAGATPTTDDAAVLREVWPGLEGRRHAYPERKIRQAAVVFLDDHRGIGTLIDPRKRLVTRPLETLGALPALGLVFCSTRRVARALYDAVKVDHRSVRLAEENDEVLCLKGTLHQPADEPEDLRCYITYSRGVLGLGANVAGIRFLVVDANAFRAIASFTPGAITPEEFERARAEERLALILQNLGRALRGEAGKTVVLFVLNADRHLAAAVRASPALLEGSELAPAFAAGKGLPQLVDQARRWLEAGGGDWPEADPGRKDPKPKGRPRGSGARTKASIVEAAAAAVRAGVTWRDFARKEHVHRRLSPEEVATLRATFGAAPPPDDAGEDPVEL
jgi:hypothetical protein